MFPFRHICNKVELINECILDKVGFRFILNVLKYERLSLYLYQNISMHELRSNYWS